MLYLLEQNSIMTYFSIFFTAIVMFFSFWRKTLISVDFFKQRRINKLLNLINEESSNKGLKAIAREQLQIEYFHYVFNFKINDKILIDQISDLIQKSKNTVKMKDFKEACAHIRLSEKGLITTTSQKGRNITFLFIALAFPSILNYYFFLKSNLDTLFLCVAIVEIVIAFGYIITRMCQQNTSVKRIQSAVDCEKIKQI